MTERFCTNCGAPHAQDERFCTECGTRFESAPAVTVTPTAETGTPRSGSTASPGVFTFHPRWVWTVIGASSVALIVILVVSAAQRVGIDDYARAWGLAPRAEQYDVCKHFVLDQNETWEVTRSRNPGLQRGEWFSYLSQQCGSTWEDLRARFPDQFSS